LLDEVCDHLAGRVRPQLDEDACGELIEHLLRSPRFVVRGESGGGEGVDLTTVAKPCTVAFHDAALREGGADYAPHAVIARRGLVPHCGPVHHLVEAGNAEVLCKKAALLVVAKVSAAAFVSSRWHG
jgi:hypothetical protein